ncbi:MAG: SPW repeat protein [Hyphomicrobium sp.]
MSRSVVMNSHYNWEDWFGIALGALVIASPLATAQSVSETTLLNAMAVGTFVVALSALELVDLRRWEEWLLLLLGAWLAGSPSILEYANDGDLRFWHVGLGLAIMALAALQYWQDRTSSDADLAQHGR